VITASAAITVDSTSIVYVGYTNDSGNFIGEVGINRHTYTICIQLNLSVLTSMLPPLVDHKFTTVLCSMFSS